MNVDTTIQGGLDFNPPASGAKGINPAIAEKYAGKSVCVIGAGFGGMALAIRLQSHGIASLLSFPETTTDHGEIDSTVDDTYTSSGRSSIRPSGLCQNRS